MSSKYPGKGTPVIISKITDWKKKFFVCISCNQSIVSKGFPIVYFDDPEDCYHMDCAPTGAVAKELKPKLDLSLQSWYTAATPKTKNTTHFLGDVWPFTHEGHSCRGCGKGMQVGGPRPFIALAYKSAFEGEITVSGVVSTIFYSAHLDCVTGYPEDLPYVSLSHLISPISSWTVGNSENDFEPAGYICLSCEEKVLKYGFPIMWFGSQENCHHVKCVTEAYEKLATIAIKKQIKLVSFGYKFGKPMGDKINSAAVVDLRQMLRNPWFNPDLRRQTGKDGDVQKFIRGCGGFKKVRDRILSLCMTQKIEVVYLGCNGGKHRSVAMAEILASESPEKFGAEHRDLERE